MAPSAVATDAPISQSTEELPPLRIYDVRESHYEQIVAPQTNGYDTATARGADSAAIVIDNGSSAIRAGWSFDDAPRLNFPPLLARYRDRKLGRTYSFVGADAYADNNARSHVRNAFEAGTGVIANWDVMENILDYTFLKLGINGSDGGVDVPIVMTEAVANLPYSRKTMTEIIFECYSAPSLAYGIDSLFSYNYNNGKTGLVVSSSHSSTHLIPVYNSKPLLTQATRMNWGGSQCAEYLLKLIKLKYPTFPGKLSVSQAEYMIRDHCYVSTDYDAELSKYLDWSGLEDRDCIIQYPFTEEIIIQKSEEELARIAEKRKESGRRLQEQAAKSRLEKLLRKEQELEYYRELETRLPNETKKEVRRLLEAEELRDEAALQRKIKDLDFSIRKSRQKDLGGPELEEEHEEPDFSLVDVPDDQLDEAGVKRKRHQRLMKSNHEARARAKAEKERERARVAEEARLDEEKRTKQPEAWLAGRRAARLALLQRLKERERLTADMGNRKSLASQMRMKNLANLASDTPTKKRRRGNGADDDNFGADDDDWGVYRQISATGDGNGEGGGGGGGAGGGRGGGASDDEDGDEDLEASLRRLEDELLQHDPDFGPEMTRGAQRDWRKSLVHAFLRGARAFDAKSAREAHQVHLNVERARVPEVFFAPSIAGLDQAGLPEIAFDILTHRLAGGGGGGGGGGSAAAAVDVQERVLRDVFLTGGCALFRGFEERLAKELRAVLPVEKQLTLRRAADPVGDAWRGASRWAGGDAWKAARVTRAEYQEKGSDYLKEHNLGNAFG